MKIKNQKNGRGPGGMFREFLDYDPETGFVTWREGLGKAKAGQRAGYVRKRDGRRDICFKGRNYIEHVVIWKMYYDRSPVGDIDHINGNPTDNRICNLREATRSQNLANCKIYANNTTGFKGVTFVPKEKKYRASITKNQKTYYLGTFKKKEAAAAAYKRAAKKLFGDFARPL
jgi:hypothetical protein